MVFRRQRDPLADLDPAVVSDARRADVQAALDAARRYEAIVGRAPEGPILDRLAALRDEVHAAVRAVFEAARRTDAKAATLADLDPEELTRRAKAARRALARAEDDGRDATEQRRATESLDRQLGSVHAVWDAVERAAADLHRLQLQLAEVVALAGALAADVPEVALGRIGGVADELQALRLALAEVS